MTREEIVLRKELLFVRRFLKSFHLALNNQFSDSVISDDFHSLLVSMALRKLDLIKRIDRLSSSV